MGKKVGRIVERESEIEAVRIGSGLWSSATTGVWVFSWSTEDWFLGSISVCVSLSLSIYLSRVF